MDAFQYAQGFVRGLGPFEYRGKNPEFYKQRHRETAALKGNYYQVEENYKFLVPSKWHKTGWKYTTLPKVEKEKKAEELTVSPISIRGKSKEGSLGLEFLSTYSASFQVPKLKKRQTSLTPKDSYSRPYSNWKLSSLRMSL